MRREYPVRSGLAEVNTIVLHPDLTVDRIEVTPGIQGGAAARSRRSHRARGVQPEALPAGRPVGLHQHPRPGQGAARLAPGGQPALRHGRRRPERREDLEHYLKGPGGAPPPFPIEYPLEGPKGRTGASGDLFFGDGAFST
jgi:hypothetical protein